MLLKLLKKLDHKLPGWMQKDRINWIPWFYALWQVLRRNSLVLLSLSFIPFFLRKFYYNYKGRHHKLYTVAVVPLSRKTLARPSAIVDSDQFFIDDNAGSDTTARAPGGSSEEGSSQTQSNRGTTTNQPSLEEGNRLNGGVSGHRDSVIPSNIERRETASGTPENEATPESTPVAPEKEFKTLTKSEVETFEILDQNIGHGKTLPEGWRAVKFRDGIYYIKKEALDMMAKWIQECDLNEHDLVFVEWADTNIVGEELGRAESYHKIFSGDYYVAGNSDFGKLSKYPGTFQVKFNIIPTWIRYVKPNSRWWAILSAVPMLLQACHLGRLSTLMTLSLIVLDSQRRRLNRAYELVFRGLRRLVRKSLSAEEHKWIYLFLSQLFTSRWLYPAERKLRKGDKFFLQNCSRLRDHDEVKITGSRTYKPSGTTLVRLWNGRGIVAEPAEETEALEAEVMGDDIALDFYEGVETLSVYDSWLLKTVSSLFARIHSLWQKMCNYARLERCCSRRAHAREGQHAD